MTESVKKRKWDQTDQSDNAPATKMNKVDIDPAKIASEAAARINAMLLKKGVSLEGDGSVATANKFTKNIPINDLKNRYMLIKGATHTQIKEETGADIVTKGKYYPDKALATDKEPPLYLLVSAPTQDSLDNAIKKIEKLIETVQVPAPGPLFPKDETKHEAPKRRFFEKILSVDVPGTPPFSLRAKIVGPGGAYVKHIYQETGCRVQIKGKGSGYLETSTGKESDEPLHIQLSCSKEEGLESAIKLTQHLLDTVRTEAERAAQNPYSYNKGGYSDKSANGYDANGYDANGYSSNGYNANGYANGYDASSYDASGYTANGYDYSAYSDYYNSYYSQQGAQDYQQYDPNAYYNYYGYAPPSTTDSTTTEPTTTDSNNPVPPPPTSSTSAPSPPPPPPSSDVPPPPPSE